MMKTAAVLVLLTALCGLSAGQQVPMSYEYQYSGEIKSGMPELRHQFAGAALKAKLRVTVKTNSEAYVQISDVQVGTMNGDVPSSGRAQLPIPSMQAIHDKAALEQSFVVHFSGQQEKLEVPSSDILWISNLRKSIVSLLRVPYVLSAPVEPHGDLSKNQISGQSQVPRSFKKLEETVHGKCNVVYSLTKASPKASMKLQQLDVDAQQEQKDSSRSRFSIRSHPRDRQLQGSSSSSSESYRLVRSVDFYDCENRVVLKRSSHGNLTNYGIGQLRGIQSRSSVSEYLLTGAPSKELSLRVEKAIVEGVVSFNPYLLETKKIVTITNQTLELIKSSESELVKKPTAQLKAEPWAFRVISPYHKDQASPDWVTFLNQDSTAPLVEEMAMTGYNLTSEMKQQIQQRIKSDIEKVTSEVQLPNAMQQGPYGGSRDGAAALKMQSVSAAVRALPTEALEQLYQQLAGSASDQSPSAAIKRQLFLDALKVSGSPAAIKVLVQKMKSKQITELEAANIFYTLSANIISPASVHDLIDYVQSIPEDAAISLKSSALINLSTIIRRLCINKKVQLYSSQLELMGQNKCTREQIAQKHIPYLQERLKSSQKQHLKAIYIQALSAIGDITSVQTLGDIATGRQLQDDTTLRLLAIQGLSRNHLINTTYMAAESILLAVAEEQIQLPQLREAAIASLFTLPKNATFWQRMALSTWREPSRRVASFIYTTIQALAHSKNSHFINQISMAKHVLPQAKPQMRSPYYSSLSLSSNYLVPEDIAAIFQYYYIASETSKLPMATNLRVKTVFGGMKFPVLRASTIGKGFERPLRAVLDIIKGASSQLPSSRQENVRLTADKYQEATRSHNRQQVSSSSADNMLILHLTLLKHIELFSPITQDSLDSIKDPRKSFVASILKSLDESKPMVGLSFYSPLEGTAFMPNDLGLPIIAQSATPTLIYGQMRAQLSPSGSVSRPVDLLRNKAMSVRGSFTTKVIQKWNTKVMVMVPWMNKTVECSVDKEATFSMPSAFSASVNMSTFEQQQAELSFTPNFQSKAPVVLFRNLPYTLVKNMPLDKDDSEQQNLKPINIIRSSPYYKSKMVMSKAATGLDAELDFQGDTPFPVNSSTLMHYLQKPTKLATLLLSPTTRQYQMAFMYNPQQSSTKTITYKFNLVNLSQQRSVSQDSNTVSVISNLSADDSSQQRMQKLRHASASRMVSSSVRLSGSEPNRTFEAVVVLFNKDQSHQNDQQVTRKESRSQACLLRSPQSSSSSSSSAAPAQLCAASVYQYPSLSQSAQLQQVLQAQIDAVLTSQIYSGDSCTQANLALVLKSTQSVSAERKDFLKAESTVDQFPALDSTEAVKSALVYDQIRMEIKEQKKLSAQMLNMTHHVSDILHGLLFPLVSHNHVNVQNPEGIVTLEGSRSLASDRYTVWVRSPGAICLVRELKVAAILDYLSPLSNKRMEHTQQLMKKQKQVESPTSNRCVVEAESVQTFAGVHYNKKAMKCDTIAAKFDQDQQDSFVVMTKQVDESASSEQEVTLIYPNAAVTIVVRKSEILVNNARISESQKEVKSQKTGQLVARITQSSSMKKVQLPNKFMVTLEQGRTINIQMEDRFRSQLAGVCGRFGSDQAADLRDSRSCLYNAEQGSMYAASWIASSELQQCKQTSSQAVQDIIKQMERYQEKCPKTLHAQASRRSPIRL